MDIALHTVARFVGAKAQVDAVFLLIAGIGLRQEGRQERYLSLERTQSVVEGAFSATAYKTETGLKAPFIIVDGSMDGWQDGG